MEEKLNAITHGVGASLAVMGLVILAASAYLYGSVWHVISFSVYGVTLVLLYLASTLYHSFRNERIKYKLKVFDHAAIYLLIAGTYTPFALVVLRGLLGWTVLGVVWAAAAAGVALKIFFARRFKILSTLCYIAMGWFVLVCVKPLIVGLPAWGFGWLLAGGVFYTVGAVFYLLKRMPYNHAVWHLFVLAGSIAHFIAVLYYVLPVQVS